MATRHVVFSFSLSLPYVDLLFCNAGVVNTVAHRWDVALDALLHCRVGFFLETGRYDAGRVALAHLDPTSVFSVTVHGCLCAGVAVVATTSSPKHHLS